jgi:hypothetical protein
LRASYEFEVSLLYYLKKMKILLIEDNKEISENIASYLELEDFKVDKSIR